jgi:hypothetical protein
MYVPSPATVTTSVSTGDPEQPPDAYNVNVIVPEGVVTASQRGGVRCDGAERNRDRGAGRSVGTADG